MPPVAEPFSEKLESKQIVLLVAALATSAVGWPMLTSTVAVQPLASMTVFV